MKRVIVVISLAYNVFTCFGQNDSASRYGTIKISKSSDTLFVKSFTDFNVYYNDPVNSLSYDDFILSVSRSTPVKRSARFLISEALPKNTKDSVYDFATYFRNHELIKKIRLKKEETDTVRFLVYVNNKGVVKFMDLAHMENHGKDRWVYDRKKKEYKVDVVHVKTAQAFEQLTSVPWVPAKIKTLKKHPSKHKVKYASEDGFMQGILTIIYSGSAMND
jgi:hypothetical protein